jgi:hypothetical protein
MMSPKTETRMADLVEVLDADIRHLKSMLSGLNTLRALLIRREDRALEHLLDDIRQQAQAHKMNEQKRQQLRRELAADLGCRAGDLTLTRLATGAGLDLRAALAQRQDRLRALAGQLKHEHTLTALLLRDCAQLNRSLLRAFFGSCGRGGTMYSPTGAEKHGTAAALMSMKL